MQEVFSYGLTVATQVIILFVLIFAGYFMGKSRLVRKTGIAQLTDFLLYVITPCLIVDAFISVQFNPDTFGELLISAGCAVLTHLIGVAFAFLFCKTKPRAKQAVYRYGIIFSNGGFMSIPMVQALAGDYGVFLVSMYIIVINVITWTYGITLYPSEQKTSRRKAIVNPGTIGIAIGLPLFFLPFALPEIITRPLEYLSDLNTPVAMIITGYYLIGSDLRKGMRDVRMWLVAALRLLVIPLIMLVMFKYLFDLQDELLIACMVPACAPCAVNNMMISAKFGGDTSLASRMISFTTILSMLTMPLILMLTKL